MSLGNECLDFAFGNHGRAIEQCVSGLDRTAHDCHCADVPGGFGYFFDAGNGRIEEILLIKEVGACIAGDAELRKHYYFRSFSRSLFQKGKSALHIESDIARPHFRHGGCHACISEIIHFLVIFFLCFPIMYIAISDLR